jgi:hypothetical protein
MEIRFKLSKYGKQLWTRVRAREVRRDLLQLIDDRNLEPGQAATLVVDAKQVEVFDYSFANELFGKTLISLPNDYPGILLLVENLNEYTRENLSKALESLGLVMIERKGRALDLIGKVASSDKETFDAIAGQNEPITSGRLTEMLKVTVNAMNERLSKLTELGLVRRTKGVSSAGREQFVYSAP